MMTPLVKEISPLVVVGISLKKAFTLIELLVVIAIMAVIAAAVLVAINPVDKIRSANDAKVQADIGAIATAGNTYATANNGGFPPTIATFTSSGEMTVFPSAPANYTAYTYVPAPAACTGTACTSFVTTGQLKALKWGAYTTWRYDSATTVACAWNGTTCKP